MKCPKCGSSVEVSLEEAARVMGLAGGRVKGGAKSRGLSRGRALGMVRAKWAKRHADDLSEEGVL